VDEGLNFQMRLFEPPVSRIAVISSGISVDHDEWPSSVDGLFSALDTCHHVAEHENNPEFILLAIQYAGWGESASMALKHTIVRLLEAEYSVHVRLHTMSTGLPEDNPVLFVLAAPFCINPQYLDDILGDLNHPRVLTAAERKVPETNHIDHRLTSLVSFSVHDPVAIAVGKGFDESMVNLLTPSDYEQVLLGVSPTFACQIATAICHVCGRLGADRQNES
jgi:hypothetical protein